VGRLVIVLVVLAIVVALAVGTYTVYRRYAQEPLGIEGYRTYRNARHGISFERPSNWRGIERTDETYPDDLWAGFLGPVSSNGISHAGLDVLVTPSDEMHRQFSTLGHYVEYLIQQNSGKNPAVVANETVTFAGLPAHDVTLEYRLQPIRSDIPDTLMRTRWLVFERKGHYYELIYGATEEDFDVYSEAFERLISTFRFES